MVPCTYAQRSLVLHFLSLGDDYNLHAPCVTYFLRAACVHGLASLLRFSMNHLLPKHFTRWTGHELPKILLIQIMS